MIGVMPISSLLKCSVDNLPVGSTALIEVQTLGFQYDAQLRGEVRGRQVLERGRAVIVEEPTPTAMRQPCGMGFVGVIRCLKRGVVCAHLRSPK